MDTRKLTNGPETSGNAASDAELTRGQQALCHLFVAFVVAVGLLLLERVLGGGWRSLWSFGSTVLLIWAGLLPVVFIESGESWTKEKILGVGAGYGIAVGLAYGVATRSPLPGVFFGMCIGHFVGLLLHLRGFQSDSFRSDKGLRVGGAVAGAIVACHLVGVMKPTRLIRVNAVAADTAQGPQSESASNEKGGRTKSQFFTQSEMEEICKKAEQLQIGATRGEVLALLGPPGNTLDRGENNELLLWSMDEKRQRFCVEAGFKDNVVDRLKNDAGVVFEQPDMVTLLKKAQTLRLGMTLQEMLRVMGPPSDTTDMVMEGLASFDSVTEEFHKGAKKRLITVTWTSADSNDRFVMVGLNETGVFNVGCNQPGRGLVYELKR